MAAYRRVYDSRHLQAGCHEPGLAPEPCARYSSMGYLYLFSNGESRGFMGLGLDICPLLGMIVVRRSEGPT